MNGKKVIFIGNSYTYYGQTVLEKSQSRLTQKERTGDKGFFYNLCRLNGADVEVTNWTFGGHSLEHLFGGNCTANRGCDGEDHKAYLTDPYFDYVIIQPGSGKTSSQGFLRDMEAVMNFFRAANPDVKFAVLVPYSAYGTIGSTITLASEFLNALKTVEAQGVTVINWGGLVMDILNGKVKVPGSVLDYTNNTFIIRKSAKDGYHPNQLSGYITTLMTYCALTGESAVDQPYGFCSDISLRPNGYGSKYFNFEGYIAAYYTYNNATTNYPEVFGSAVDMLGIQKLIDAHLLAKAHLDFNYPVEDGESPEAPNTPDTPEAPNPDNMTDSEAVAAGYVAKLLNDGTETFLTLSELQEKITGGYANGDFITLLTDVSCKGATSSNMSKTKTVSVTFDLSGKTLTLTRGSIMRTTYKNGYKSTFNLISSNGKGTLTLAPGNTYSAFQAYGQDKLITVGTELGYTDGDVVDISAARLLYISTYYDNTGSTSSFTFFGGEYNQTHTASEVIAFITTAGKYNEGYSTNYFAGHIRFIGAKINQKVESDYTLFATVLTDEGQIPEVRAAVPGIILTDCEINAFSEKAAIHSMETLTSLITYTGCKIYGDISALGTDPIDTGLGKVVIGEGTTFTAPEGIVKSYDSSAIETFDGTTSGIYLAEGCTLEKTESGFKAVKA